MSLVLPFPKKYRLDIGIIIALTILTLVVRVPIAAERKIMPAGDAFNFQHIASYIQYGEYPSKEKRLPTYPLFILLGRTLGFDPIQTSITISLAASTGTIISLYILGRIFNFNRAALAAFLGIAIFDPLLISNAIRPLADGLFVFLVATTFMLTALFLRMPKRATKNLQILYSIVLTLLMFTRYEGFLIAGLTAPFLFIKLPWRQVTQMAILPIVATLLWIPAYKSIHGSVTGLSYVTDATNAEGGFGEIALIPENFNKLMDGSGFRRVWAQPEEIFEEGMSVQSIEKLFVNPSWWFGVLAVIGIIFIVLKGGYAGFAIILASLGYILLLSWWWVYSRYVAPISIIFYLAGAGGMTVLVNIGIHILHKKKPLTILASFIPLIAVPIMVTQIPLLLASALNRSWESNRKGFDLYRAMVETEKENAIVVYPTKEHANATLYFGDIRTKKSNRNPAKGLYLSDYPNESPEELYTALAEWKPKFFIETDFDKRIPRLINTLRQRENIKDTRVYKETRWDTLDVQTTNVYELTWP